MTRDQCVGRVRADLAGWHQPWIVGWFERTEGPRVGVMASRRIGKCRYDHRDWFGRTWQDVWNELQEQPRSAPKEPAETPE